jgi:tRNA(Ile)-lysidine synthase
VHLADAPATAAPDLLQTVGEVLDRRLLRGGAQPLAVALSGGGDSLALLLLATAWAKAAGRSLLVLTVDHRLRVESGGWTRACATNAQRLGHPFQALAWTGAKPATGLPAAARAARHALLADAAREAGARAILMGHTADDVLEARLMRAEGSTTPDPREWAPSPAWPQGRGVFLLRPLLGVRRADLRAWLSARGERWIDDPANADPSYARPRARQMLAKGALAAGAAEPTPSARALALACRPDPDAGLRIDRAELRTAEPAALARFVSAACLCAAGTARPPAGGRVQRLAGRLTEPAPFVATLAGARVEAGAQEVRFLREPGEAARGGLAPIRLKAGETGVWDGRFEITAEEDLEVRATPRSSQPDIPGAKSLTYDRLLAACGVVEREPG